MTGREGRVPRVLPGLWQGWARCLGRCQWVLQIEDNDGELTAPEDNDGLHTGRHYE